MQQVSKHFLADKEAGKNIICSSSRGPQYLTLTLKVHDGVYAHEDIIEGDKDQKVITSLLRLGKTVKIGEYTFEDLDEVMGSRYVNPLVANLRMMLGYRKFSRGSKVEVDEYLRHEKLANSMRIVYSFGVSLEHPVPSFYLIFAAAILVMNTLVFIRRVSN